MILKDAILKSRNVLCQSLLFLVATNNIVLHLFLFAIRFDAHYPISREKTPIIA